MNKTSHAIRWLVIYPVDSVIQPLNNWGLYNGELAQMVERPLCMREVPRSIPGFSNATSLFFFLVTTTIFAISERFFFFSLFVVAVFFSSPFFDRSLP